MNPKKKPKGAPAARTMLSHLEQLLREILVDDRTAVQKTIKQFPQLLSAPVPSSRLYDSAIHHWLYTGDTAIHLAAAGHLAPMVKLLLNAGADPNAVGSHRNARPLHYAADGQPQSPSFDAAAQIQTIKLLLATGADIHAADKNGATALHRAVRTRSAAAVAHLLQSGANPLAKNLPGATPFHLAVQNTGRGGSGSPAAKAAQRKIITAFLHRGLSPLVQDTRGRSVRDWATSPWIQDLLSHPRTHD